MTTQTINLIPAELSIRAAIGASVSIRFDASNADGTPFDLTLYTVTAPFSPAGATPPPVAAWATSVDPATPSTLFLSLGELDTAALAPTGKSITWHWAVWLDTPSSPERLLFSHGDLGLLAP